MREMKDSGVEWIGTVPKNWNIFRNKNAFDCSKDIVGEKSSVVQLLSLTTKGIKKKDITNTEGKLPETFDTYQMVRKNDLVMCLFDLDMSAVFSGISPYSGMISPAYRILTCTERIYPKYADYWFQYISHGRKFNHYAKNIRYTLGIDEFFALPMLFPPVTEQRKIADYLDDKCSKIDTIIAKQEKIIDKLKEYRVSIITEKVTKGLCDNLKYKDSGLEWIGLIPEHWSLQKLKYLAEIMRGRFNHRPRNDPRFYDGEFPFVQTGDVARAEKYITEFSQTLNMRGRSVSKEFPTGSICMTIAANVGDVAILNFDACFPDSIVGFVPKNDISRHYLFYVLKAMKQQLVRNAIISTQLNLNIEIIKEEFIPLPTEEEQIIIAKYLDQKCERIEKQVAYREQLISKFTEYKKSLIYECVTGKKEII